MNGFYVVYFTGATGSGFAMLVFKDGIVIGADVAGGIFDGEYKVIGNEVEGKIVSKLPPGAMSVTGHAAGKDGLTLEIPIHLPTNLGDGHTIPLQTTFGPVNIIVKKLRDLA